MRKKNKNLTAQENILKLDLNSSGTNKIFTVNLSKLKAEGDRERERQPGNDSISKVRPDLPTSRLVTRKRDWPPIRSIGLEMICLGDKMFAYQYKQHYQDLDKQDTDPVTHQLIDLTFKEPWYVKSLLYRCYQSFKARDFDLMADNINKALYMLEFSAAPSFHFTGSGCQISYDAMENRQLFVALFYRAALASVRDEYDVAFEVCKLLIGLQPNRDDIGSVLLLELCALKLDDHQYLIDFYFAYQDNNMFDTFPTLLYSCGLSMSRINPLSPYTEKILTRAVKRLPMLGVKLLDMVRDKTGVTYNTTTSGAALSVSQKLGRTDKTMSVMYLHRCGRFWLQPDAAETCKLLSTLLCGQDGGLRDKQLENDSLSLPLMRHLYLSCHASALLKYIRGSHLSDEYVSSPLHCFDPFPIRSQCKRATRKILCSSSSNSGVMREDSKGRLCMEVELLQLHLPKQIIFLLWDVVRTFLPFSGMKKMVAARDVNTSEMRLIFTDSVNSYQLQGT